MSDQTMERRSGHDRRRLSGAQKAAALMIIMGPESSTRLLKHLDADDVRNLTRAAATLGIVDRRMLNALVDQFEADMRVGPNLVGDVSEARQIASSTLTPDEVSSLVTDIEGKGRVDVWTRLQTVQASDLAKLLASENIQVGALVLSKLDPSKAAQTLGELPVERQAQLLGTTLSMQSVPAPILAAIERGIGQHFARAEAGSGRGKAPIHVAAIINRMDAGVAGSIIGTLSQSAPDQIEAIRARVFQFADIALLSHKDRSALLDQAPTEKVILALKGADDSVRSAALSCLGARARRMVEAELASGDEAPQREIVSAQRSIADKALEMADAGLIDLSARGADGAIVESAG